MVQSVSPRQMPQSFFLVRLGAINGPMTFGKVLDSYYGGQIHDSTPVWNSILRRWHRFAELKLPLVMKLQPEAATGQVEVAWVADCTFTSVLAKRKAAPTILSQRRIFRFSTSRSWPRWKG